MEVGEPREGGGEEVEGRGDGGGWWWRGSEVERGLGGVKRRKKKRRKKRERGEEAERVMAILSELRTKGGRGAGDARCGGAGHGAEVPGAKAYEHHLLAADRGERTASMRRRSGRKCVRALGS